MPEYFQRVLFAGVGAICLALALLEWRRRPRLARLALAIGAFSSLCFAADYAWARYAIRIDLLLTIPLVSLAGLVAGVLALSRGLVPARVLGGLLALLAGASLTWFSYATYRTTAEGARITALYDEGTTLFWNETIRCENNFEKRFGPFSRRDDPCLGNLLVRSRSPAAYPFTRVAVNDRSEAQLLFSPQGQAERPVGVRAGVFAHLARANDGRWSGDGDSGFGATHILLVARPPGKCEAKITHYGKTSILSMEREELPPCPTLTNPPVTYVGAWGEIANEPSNSRRLLQIWLWAEDPQRGRGVLVNDLASSGMHRDFVFLKHFDATRAGNRWSLTLRGEKPTSLTITIDGQNARVTGPATLVGSNEEVVLERAEVISDPRIELVPLRDRALFERYLESALFNLDLSWTAP